MEGVIRRCYGAMGHENWFEEVGSLCYGERGHENWSEEVSSLCYDAKVPYSHA